MTPSFDAPLGPFAILRAAHHQRQTDSVQTFQRCAHNPAPTTKAKIISIAMVVSTTPKLAASRATNRAAIEPAASSNNRRINAMAALLPGRRCMLRRLAPRRFEVDQARCTTLVMAGLVPAIHVF